MMEKSGERGTSVRVVTVGAFANLTGCSRELVVHKHWVLSLSLSHSCSLTLSLSHSLALSLSRPRALSLCRSVAVSLCRSFTLAPFQ